MVSKLTTPNLLGPSTSRGTTNRSSFSLGSDRTSDSDRILKSLREAMGNLFHSGSKLGIGELDEFAKVIAGIDDPVIKALAMIIFNGLSKLSGVV